MAEMKPPPRMPLVDEEGIEVGEIEWTTLHVAGSHRSLDLRGTVRLNGGMVRWSSSIPIGHGWALVKVDEEIGTDRWT